LPVTAAPSSPNGGESLPALVDGKLVDLRIPYPMGFFSKNVDGRIDDANAGWKGRGLWTTFGSRTVSIEHLLALLGIARRMGRGCRHQSQTNADQSLMQHLESFAAALIGMRRRLACPPRRRALACWGPPGP
jgi:hypothetical protein